MSHPAIQEIVAVFGQPVAGNPTQYMMEKAFAQVGLDWRYLTLEVAPADLADAIRGMRAMGFRGCNLTIPHKVAVIQYLDRTSEAATLMGAVNCVNRVGDELVGENTDGKGFVQSLREVTDPTGKNVVILGAGGAARAIAVEVGPGRRGADHGGQSRRGPRPGIGRPDQRQGARGGPVREMGRRLRGSARYRRGDQRHVDRPGRRRSPRAAGGRRRSRPTWSWPT